MKQTTELTVTRVSKDDRYLYSSDEVQIQAGGDYAYIIFYTKTTDKIHPNDKIKITIEYDNDD